METHLLALSIVVSLPLSGPVSLFYSSDDEVHVD